MPQIQQYIREEVARQLSLVATINETPTTLDRSLRRAIQTQVAEALPSPTSPISVAAPLTYAEAVRRPSAQPPLPSYSPATNYYRCITLVELYYDVVRCEPLRSAMRGGVGKKRLHVYDFDDVTQGDPLLTRVVLNLITSMKHVDEMVFLKQHHPSIDSVPPPRFSLNRAVATTLKRLNLAELNSRDPEVTMLTSLLVNNNTLSKLSIGTSMHLINHTFNYSVLTALTSYHIGPNQLRDFEYRLYEKHCQVLADACKRSPNLHVLTLSAPNSGRFLQPLVPMVAMKYNLLNVSLPHTKGSNEMMEVVVEVARRNRSLVWQLGLVELR
ncbi:hypothetical protein HPB51_015030 [Rhipicephalus microplus]|uniref:Uncharacterized protein n=1 Tax=Rhipicephalus microplus TaxID=6941 RepID=A0A9J6ETQ3_RHIMP|nr:hypothetical protein HPB51_015030 [Rhipicephalus microplus]